MNILKLTQHTHTSDMPTGGGTNLKFALVGKYDYSSNDNYEQIEILGTYENPDFNENDRSFDQMLLKLARPSSNQWVTVNLDPTIPAREARITVVGLGSLQVDGDIPTVLQQVTVDYVPNEECSKAKDNVFTYETDISPDMICILGSDEGQCNGDSGGPYLLLGDSVTDDVQVGMVSW
jgi:secreted trypsin-like serine protease